jgi:ribosomal protein S10
MPHQSLTKIIGEPTHTAMKKLEKELASNLIAVDCPWGINRGYLGELLPAAIFQVRYGAAYTPPAAAPPAYPVIPPGATTAAQEELRATNEEAQKNWQTMLHVRRIAVNLASEAIEDIYYAELDDPIEGLNGVEIQDLIEHIKDRYCHIDQANLDANLEKFNQGINPSVPLIAYIRKQEDCQEFANEGHVQISEETMVTTSTKHALQCGAFTESWKEWNRIPRANRTWLAWKTHWTRAFEEQKTMQLLTGGDLTALSATKTNDDELANQMVNSLDNLALAEVQKTETLKRLIQINEMKESTIKHLMSQLAAKKETSSKLLDIIQKAGLNTTATTNSIGGKGKDSKWDPNGYCWMHGFRVTKNHSSLTCKTRKEGHQEGATRANIMGGSRYNISWRPQS